MEIQTEQKESKKAEPKKEEKVPWKTDKINLVLYIIVGGIVGSALFAATTYGAQTVTNISTLIGGLGGGVISGFLTLQGVKRAIELQKEKEREESKPQKIRSIHVMIKLMEGYQGRIHTLNQSVNSISKCGDTEELKAILTYLDGKGIGSDFDTLRDKMIEESLRVNGDIYFSVKENLKNISPTDTLLDSYIFTEKSYSPVDLQEEITKCIEGIIVLANNIEADLEKELSKYENSLFS